MEDFKNHFMSKQFLCGMCKDHLKNEKLYQSLKFKECSGNYYFSHKI